MKRQTTVRTRQPAAAEKTQARQGLARQPQAQREAAGVAHRANSGTELTPEERNRMIATAAYHHAEQRGFAAGHELEDWLAAEVEIRRQLGEHGPAAMTS